MKKLKKNFVHEISVLWALLCIFVVASCSSDSSEVSSEEVSAVLQQYKWVLRTSDDALIDDDFQWAIFDDYVYTIYFASNYECVIGYYRKHTDTDSGVSYERDAQTVRYIVQGNKIILDGSKYTEDEFTYKGDYIYGELGIYQKEVINDSDREWLKNNIKHIELSPDESTSTPFKGLKEIMHDGNVLFGNPHCDNMGRLTYYRGENKDIKYVYSQNQIVSRSYDEESERKITYTLTNGLITSYTRDYIGGGGDGRHEYGSVKYDNNRRVVQIIDYSPNQSGSYNSTTYDFKWNSSGDIYESSTTYEYHNGDPSYVETYEYLSSNIQLPPISYYFVPLSCVFRWIDPILLMEGYYGNSMPTHMMKSYTMYRSWDNSIDRYAKWTYTFDSKGRLSKIIEDAKYYISPISYTMTVKWD